MKAQFSDVVRAMATDPDVIEAVVEAARNDSTDVASLPIAENRRHIAVMVAAGLAAFDDSDGPGVEDFAAAARLGTDRAAQGIPLTELLKGVHAGRSRVIAIAVERSRAIGVPSDVLLDVLLDFERYAGALERHVVSGYHTAELQLARTKRDIRTQVLRKLLIGEGQQIEVSDDELSRVNLSRRRSYFCLRSDVADPVQSEAIERRLADAGGVFGLVEGKLAGLIPRLPGKKLITADELVVAAPAAPLREIPALYATAGNALATARASGRHGLHQLADLAVETALATQPDLAAILARDLLGALDPGDAFHQQLVRTAKAYLDADRRLDRTAAALHLHPNTVRYRLSRLTALTGWSPDTTSSGTLQTMRNWWALHTWLAAS
ncbi:helix-turn-helix domain-containing protein [Kribbella sp. NBC_01245]|uniref:PucR family transcriptional regulator n=1 Tax=Kribbella sp. NBC_01245 TaxID=2903578 RepID=UPI002E28F043|nr:helix-turn-helix domain-containing protein [Kribbella sp. NBC_01245]